jgi:hypothetical protein
MVVIHSDGGDEVIGIVGTGVTIDAAIAPAPFD